MATKKQIEANRRNARKSTGPMTANGKSKSRLNALKHGLSSQEIVIPGEHAAEFDDLRDDLQAELEPEGALESQLVDRLAACMWRLRRFYKLEAAILAADQITVEMYRAREEVDRYEITQDPFPSFGEPITRITDETRHRAASRKLELVENRLREDLPALGSKFKNDADGLRALSMISRFEGTIERAFYRALHELQRLQALRHGKDVKAPLAVDVNVDLDGSALLDKS